MIVYAQGNISIVLQAQGKLQAALTMLHEVLATCEKTVDQNHLLMATTYNQYATSIYIHELCFATCHSHTLPLFGCSHVQ